MCWKSQINRIESSWCYWSRQSIRDSKATLRICVDLCTYFIYSNVMKQKLKGFWREQTRHQRKRRNQSTKFWKIYRVKEVVPTMNMHWQNHLMQRIFKQSLLSQKKSGKQQCLDFMNGF